MRRLALAVLSLSLEIVGLEFASNAGNISPVSAEAPSTPLGSRVASESTCLNGNSTLESCAGGEPAGITYATTSQDWKQTISSTLTGGKQAKVTLTPCPTGIDTTSGAGYQVLLSGGGNSEAVNVVPTSGDCTSAASSGTIHFAPFYSYSSGYTIGSASSGLQETVNQACGTSATTWKNAHCNVTLPASGTGYPESINTYNVYGTLFWHANESTLTASGAVLNCLGRGACLQVGDQVNSNDYGDNTIRDLTFRPPVAMSSLGSAFQGVLVSNTVANGSYKTITTATAHNFRPGDMVTVLFTDDAHYWGDSTVYDCGSGSSAAACTSSSATFRVAYSGTIASQATPGVVALAYVGILDNAENTKFDGITIANAGSYQFNNFFDVWDDENFTLTHFNNNSHSMNGSATWSGSFVAALSATGHVAAPVINIKDSNFTAAYSNCVTDYVNNSLFIDNVVCQASGLWQFHASVEASGIGKGIFVRNVYSESNNMNPASPPRTPYYGTGQAGLILGALSQYSTAQVAGQAGFSGGNASGGTGSTPYTYYIVVNDVSAGKQSAPLPIYYYASTGSDSPVVNWPRVANAADVITYDVLRCSTSAPYVGGTPGGSTTACGSVTTALSQASACTANGGLICTYTDTASASTTAYSENLGTYSGLLAFWPGTIVSVNHSIRTDVEQGGGVGLGLGGDPLLISANCDSGGVPNYGGYTSCLNAPVGFVYPGGTSNLATTILADNVGSGAQNTAVTGRLNFPSPTGNAWQAHQILTLMDSNPFLTLQTQGYRRPASVNDAWIGTDAPHNTPLSTTMLAIGAGQSITEYIANIGSTGTYPYGGAGWLERLTSKQKTFAVPVKVSDGNSFTLGNGSPLSQMKIYSVNNMPGSHVPPQSCVDVVREAKGLTKSDQITSITPPGRLGNLSLNAHPADEGAIILHFCNPSGSEAITPAGAYSFLAVR